MLVLALASLADNIVLRTNSHPSSTWSIHRDVVGSGRIVRRSLLYRRGGSEGSDNVTTAGLEKSSTSRDDDDDEERVNGTNSTATTTTTTTLVPSSSLTGGRPLSYSSCSVQGERQYMEDEHFVERGSRRFAAVFDGHGGAAVSRYLRQNLYANFQAALPTSGSASAVADVAAAAAAAAADDDGTPGDDDPAAARADAESSIIASALEAAFDKVDSEVGSISHWSFQGSTALAVAIHENVSNGTRSIVSANVGDSRAVLSRRGTAMDLTRDHKPNDRAERERIESLGGTVDWCGEFDRRGRPVEHTGVYRINRNLALSRAIGDRSERPWVTNAVDLAHCLIDEDNDSFVLLATDGLFDVMTSQEVVTFVHGIMDSAPQEHRQELQHDIAKYVVEEALKRGSSDNITVVVLWVNGES